MERRGQAGRHHAGVCAGIVPVDRHGRHDPGQLDLELQGAVEIEVPVEPVLVVADGGDGADHQAPRPAHFGAPRHHVDVLPEDGVVLLVHADGVVLRVRLAPLVGEDVVEVVDLAEAVAPQGQRVGHAAQTPLPGVERTLPRVHGARVPVGHDHLAHRGPVHDRPHPPAVLVADGGEHQSLQRVHADAQRPLLPAHEVALHLKARALGLGDLQWLQVRAQRPVVLGVVAPRRGRDGDDPVVEHLEDLAPSHVDDGQQALDGAGVAVVVGGGAQVGDALGDAAALLVLEPEGAGRPGVDLDQGMVGDAAPVEGGVPLGVLLQGERARR